MEVRETKGNLDPTLLGFSSSQNTILFFIGPEPVQNRVNTLGHRILMSLEQSWQPQSSLQALPHHGN